MADAVRSVTIRVNVERGETKLDMTDVKRAASETAKATAEIAATSTKAAEAAKSHGAAWAAGLANLKGTGDQLEANRELVLKDLTAQREKAAAAKEAARAEKEAEDNKAKAQKQATAEQKLRKKEEREAEQAATKAASAQQAQMQALDKLGRGTAHIIRAVALSFIDVKEEGGKLIGTVAAIQAGFDTFVGTIDILSGIKQGLGSLQTASTAATAAQQGLAASNIAVATTASTAKNAMIAFNASLGPEMLLIAGITAAWSALSMEAKKTADAYDEADKKMQKALATRARGEAGRRDRSAAMQRGQQENAIDMGFQKIDAADIKDKSSLIADTYSKLADKWGEAHERMYDANQLVNKSKGGSIDFAIGMDRAKTAAEDLVRTEQQYQDILKRDLDVKRELVNLARQEVDHARSLVDTNKAAYDMEQGRQQSTEARLQQLTPGQYARLQRSIGRAAEGKATRRDYEALESFAPEFVERDRARKAREAGRTAGVLDPITEGLGAKDRLAGLRTSLEGAGDIWSEATRLLEQRNSAEREVAAANKALHQESIKRLEEYKNELVRMKNGFKQINNPAG